MTFWMCYFSRSTMKKAFFPRKLLCLRAVNLPIKRARGNITFRKLSPTRGKALRFTKTRRKRISLNTTRPKQLVWSSVITTTRSTTFWLNDGNSNPCRSIRSVIGIKVISKPDFRCMERYGNLTPKQEPSAHAFSVTDRLDLKWRVVCADPDSTVFSYSLASFQDWVCLEINTIV